MSPGYRDHRPYGWNEQFSIGKQGEDAVVSVLSRYGELRPSTMDEQKVGIDFHLWSGHVERTIEVKTDALAVHTGNIYVETIKNSNSGAPGWAYSCTAELLVFYLPKLEWVVVVPTARLKKMLPEWEERMRRRTCQNKGYFSTGLLVPIEEVTRLARYIDYVPKPYGGDA